jgi:4-carboxymuconolactone decarboxylase
MTQGYLNERGKVVAKEMYGPNGDEHHEAAFRKYATRVDEDWAHIICDLSMNGMYARTILSTAEREMCAIAALVAMQELEALDAHLRIGMESHSVEVVREVIVQMGVLVGMPKALKALRLLERILAEGRTATSPLA